MMKKIFALLFALFILTISVSGADQPRLVDGAYILWEHEEAELTEKLDGISEESGLDVVVVTVESLDGVHPRDYADDFYDYNGYGADGVLLLVAMDEREWWISTSGYGITAFTDAGIAYIGEKVAYELGEEYYADAVETFAELCEDFIAQARSGEPYDIHNLPEEPFDPLFTGVIAVVAGLIVALIATGIMRGQLKSVRYKAAASEYVREGSLSVTEARDFFLYRTVSRRKKPESNSSGGSSTHTSSSGRSHGGGGGGF